MICNCAAVIIAFVCKLQFNYDSLTVSRRDSRPYRYVHIETHKCLGSKGRLHSFNFLSDSLNANQLTFSLEWMDLLFLLPFKVNNFHTKHPYTRSDYR